MSALHRSVRVAACAALLASAGCAYHMDARGVGVPVTLAEQPGQKLAGQAFKVSGHATYAFWGIATLSEPSLKKILAAQLLGAKAVTDVRVKIRSRWGDLLLTALTGGLIVPRTVTVEGTVVGDSTAAPAATAK